MDNLTLAYMAGILDGEGSIGIYICKSGNKYSSHMLVVAVKMTIQDAVDLFAETYGVVARWSGPRGNSKPCKTVVVRSEKAAQCLRDLLPYLRVKRPQAELAIEFQELKVDWLRTASRPKGWSVGLPRMSEEEWTKRESFRSRMFQLNSGRLGSEPKLRAVAETEWRGAARKSRDATVRTSQECEEGGGNGRPTSERKG